MPGTDLLTAGLADVAESVRLLTRIPLPGSASLPRGGAAAWAWPVAGLFVGAIAAVAGGLAHAAGLGPGISAAVILAVQAIATGGLHEDGLADTFDGFWGGHDKARRLEIMKDSRIGTYGVLALVFTILVRWSALAALFAAGSPAAAVLAVAALSRVPMAALMAALPNARGTGLSQLVGRPDPITVARAAALAFAAALILTGWPALLFALIAALVTLGLGLLARTRIGGQTGDVLGASQQLTETALLAAAAALL